MGEVWFKNGERYVQILAMSMFPDHKPKFQVGDRVVFQHTMPGLEGRISAVFDPRSALLFMGNGFESNLHDWAAFCGRRKSELAEEHVYSVQFEEPSLTFPVAPGTPEQFQERFRTWNKVAPEAELEAYETYWARMTLDANADHRDLPDYEARAEEEKVAEERAARIAEEELARLAEQEPQETDTEITTVDIESSDGESTNIAVMEEEANGQASEEDASEGEEQGGNGLPEGPAGNEAGDGSGEREE